MAIDHWMMFGTFAEKRYFIYPNKEEYKGVIINANMAAHAPAGMATFLLENTPEQKYIIDPLTHAFQHDPSVIKTGDQGEIRIKKSIAKLVQQYGNPITQKAGITPVLPGDFNNDNILNEFVKNCIEFQKNILSLPMNDSDTAKYFDDEEIETQFTPYALVVPYFYLKETNIDKWLPIMGRAAQFAVSEYNNEKIFIEIVIEKGVLLNKNSINHIFEAFNIEQIAGVIIWVDAFDEHDASIYHLKGLLHLVRKFRNLNKEVINLHGSYFSIIAGSEKLGNPAFSGVAHGPQYGESRPVVPVGGGLPVAKYYIPKLHARVNYKKAVKHFYRKGLLKNTEAFYSNVCDCKTCKDTINGDINNFASFGESFERLDKRGHPREYQKPDSKKLCLEHYLNRKSIEYKFASNGTEKDIFDELNKGFEEYQEILGDQVDYLIKWQKAFED